MGSVLVVDDEQGLRDALAALIAAKGHRVTTAKSAADAKTLVANEDLDLVVTDLRLERGTSGIDVLRAAKSKADAPEVVVMTAFGTRETALEALESGAFTHVEKGPHLAQELAVLVEHAISARRLKLENVRLREQLVGRYSLEGIVGRSETMREVFALVQKIAPTRANVLISGESGTGKERIARAIHFHSGLDPARFVPLNCGAIPENLIESELFGHVKGAFTGAESSRRGLFEAANQGTIFLDEIGELPLALQPKLLRVLQERKVKPVGATQEVEVNARVIAATNRDLETEVRAGRFREDLYFRLNVLQIDLPPLRDRREDIPLLVITFLSKFAREYGRDVRHVAPEAMSLLLDFPYRGNVRQLENIIERAVALATGPEITVAQLPREVVEGPRQVELTRAKTLESQAEFPEQGVDLERLVEDFERKLIEGALDRAGGVKTRAAELLGLTFRQFRYKLLKYGMGRGSER
ncbi:MAG: sigma-54-dependent Fis family transcriptional regulator [Deltaproteobacteria bacterium]|nr:sigma-54-dependent Fis family transcriptional regulator [Deltaproteobacteria bacterium]